MKTIESDEPGHSMHSEEEEKGELDERRSSTALSSLKLGGTYEERKSSGVIISDRLGMHEGDTGPGGVGDHQRVEQGVVDQVAPLGPCVVEIAQRHQ